MIPRRPYYYTPDEFFTFGLAGEHPVTFLAWIDDDGPDYKLSVRIISVIVNWRFQNPMRQVTDIVEEVNRLHYEKYADEIRESYLAKRNADWEEDIA